VITFPIIYTEGVFCAKSTHFQSAARDATIEMFVMARLSN
jgi:hypothetical protein